MTESTEESAITASDASKLDILSNVELNRCATPAAIPAPTSLASTGVARQAQPSLGNKAKHHSDVQAVLEKLFDLYPALFGERFLPLKLGIFQELLSLHPQDFERATLKLALGVHTRSSRYLQSVARGLARHDLAGQAVEPVAPEHIYLAIVELFRRRQVRSKDDLQPTLQKQFSAAYASSRLAKADYLARLPAADESVSLVLGRAIDEVDQQRARLTALTRAFAASGQSAPAFADSLGMDVAQLRAALKPA